MSGPIAGRFELEAEVATGGMGTVYCAQDRLTGSSVAVKLLSGRRGLEGERFLREATALAELSHPGIVRYVAHGTTALGQPYLAMEWLDGETLADRLARDRLRLDEVLTLALRVTDALAEAHRRGLVHRDIKPSNLLLEGRDVARTKLIDFGIVRRPRDVALTMTGALVGTPKYMA